MLNFITDEHRMISASMAALCADLGRVDRERMLVTQKRIAPSDVKEGLDSLGLFEGGGLETPSASSLVQTLLAIEAGKATLPYPILENLSAAFLAAHLPNGGESVLDPAASIFTRPGLTETELPILHDGILSGVAAAVSFPKLCQKLIVTVRCSSDADPYTRAIVLVDLEDCRCHARGSVEPDYPVCDVTFPDIVLPETAIIRRLVGDREPSKLLALHDALLAAGEMAGTTIQLIEMTKDYLLTRTAFGKPLGSQQVLKHTLAKHYVQSQALIMMLQYSAKALDAGAAGATELVHATKYFAGNSSKEVAQDMLQLHGSIGYTLEHPLHISMRRILRLAASHGSTYTSGDMLYWEYCNAYRNNQA